MTRAVHRPTWLGSTLSVAAGVLAVAIVAAGTAQFRALGVEVVGLAVFAAGVELWHRGSGVAGGLLGIVGVGVVGTSLLLGVSGVGALADQVELLPGMVGVFLLATGLVALRAGWERHLITAGTALVLLGVVGSGIVRGASAAGLLAAAVATVVAWDLGEQAVNLGEQVGRRARTYPVELAHGAGSLAVGGVGIALALGVRSAHVTDVPLAGLVLLVVAGVTLTLALYS